MRVQYLFGVRGTHPQLRAPCPRRPPGGPYQPAVLGHGDAAGVHREMHALADAGCESIGFPGPLAPVPAGAPATDTESQEVRPLRPFPWGSTAPLGLSGGFCCSEAWGCSSPSSQRAGCLPRGLFPWPLKKTVGLTPTREVWLRQKAPVLSLGILTAAP